MSQKIKKHAKKFFAQRKPRPDVPHFRLINYILAGLFFVGLILIIWEIKIYQKTFIPLGIPLSIWLLSCVIPTPFLRKFLTIYLPTSSLFLQLVNNIVIFGGIAVFSFMWLNYHFRDKESTTFNETIIKTVHLARGRYGSCEQSYVIVNYLGLEKQLMYHCGIEIERYKDVDLAVSKGLFGYDVVVTSNLRID